MVSGSPTERGYEAFGRFFFPKERGNFQPQTPVPETTLREVLSAGSLDNRITEAIGTPILSGHWNIVHVNNGPDVALTFIPIANDFSCNRGIENI